MRHLYAIPITPVLAFLARAILASPVARDDSSSAIPSIHRPAEAIQWTPCSNNTQIPVNLVSILPAELECGNLVVPLDHANPPSPDVYNANNTVKLGMSRLRALSNNTGGRQSLIISPGGPGLAAWITLLAQLQVEGAGGEKGVVSKAIREKYDVIAVDQRGVGLSQALQCDNSLRDSRPDITVSTKEAYDELAAWNKAYGESCFERSGDLVRYMDSKSVAKDYELVRQALGEAKLNMAALSYGTVAAAQYIDLHPENVGRFMLDGIFGHLQDFVHATASDSAAFQASLQDYFDWCDFDDGCKGHFGSGSNTDTNTISPDASFSTAKVFDDILDKILQAPLPAKGCQGENSTCLPTVGLREFITIAQTGLQFQQPLAVLPTSWANLTTALASAYAGDGTPFATSRSPTGADADASFSPAAGGAVMCLDWERIPSFEALQRQRKGYAALFEHTRGHCNIETAALNCIGWPFEPVNPPMPLNVAQTGKIADVLILQSTLDPSTGVEWAVGLKEQIPNSRFVLRGGAGHTSYLLFGEASVIADRYFVDGELPGDNTVTSS